jgi:sarcosine oxidase, subunit beta
MPNMIEVDVAIIGGGIIGASTALELRRRGLSVALIERDFCGARASGVNYGGIRRQGRPLSQLPLAMRAHDIWLNLESHIGIDGEFIQTGHLKLARTEADMVKLEHYAATGADNGLTLELLDGPALRRLYPGLAPTIAGGSFSPDDGHANPRLVAPAFARAAARAGALVLEQREVVWAGSGPRGFLLRCHEGTEVHAARLVNAAGAWATSIAGQFGDHVPMQVLCPTMIVTEPLPDIIPVNIGMEGGGIYLRQAVRGNCVIGGGRGYLVDALRSRPGVSGIEATTKRAVEIFPALRQAQIIRSWSGIEAFMPDKNPVIGQSPKAKGLFHAFGFSGGGFQIGPAVGILLSELIVDGRSFLPVEAFAVDRFGHSPAEPDLDKVPAATESREGA